jgi:YggT family protein
VIFSIAALVDRALDFYGLLIFGYIILSWFPASGTVWEIRRVLGTVVEPYLGIFRRIVPTTGAMDFSPLVGLLVLQFIIQPVFYRLLSGLGM